MTRFLVVRTGTRRVGVALGPVLEIITAVAPRPVPASDPAVRGLVPVRDRLVPLVDLGVLLGDEPVGLETGEAVAAVVRAGRGLVALLVAEAEAVHGAELLPPPGGEEMPGLLGLAPDGTAVPVVDSGALLARLLETESLA